MSRPRSAATESGASTHATPNQSGAVVSDRVRPRDLVVLSVAEAMAHVTRLPDCLPTLVALVGWWTENSCAACGREGLTADNGIRLEFCSSAGLTVATGACASVESPDCLPALGEVAARWTSEVHSRVVVFGALG